MERRDRIPAGDRPFGRANPLTDAREPRPLVPLGDYEQPTLPTQQTLRRMWDQAMHTLRPKEDAGPVVDRGKLDRSTQARLDGIAPGPATAPAEADLAAALDPWVADETSGPRLQIVVLPPCAPRDPLETWARRAGLTCLAPSPRAALLDMPVATGPDLSGAGVLVVPRLEDWMLRHETGLGALRTLLSAVAMTERRMILGCGSWAWAFLSKAVEADLALPRPQTLAPHDGARLKVWLGELAGPVRSEGSTFRLASDGTDVFGDDGEGDAHFRKLAAASHGISWIAWTLWRRSLRTRTPNGHEEVAEEARAEAARDDDRTVWIVDPTPPSLPRGHERAALMVLHAVLVHGTLDLSLVDRVLPAGHSDAVLEALASTDFVHRDGSVLAPAPSAYAEARRALVNAGFPADGL